MAFSGGENLFTHPGMQRKHVIVLSRAPKHQIAVKKMKWKEILEGLLTNVGFDDR